MQEILFVLHGFVKNTVTAMTSSITDNFQKIIGRILMYIGLLLLVVMFIIPFVIFRICVHFTLKIFYGKLYGGLLNGGDLMFAINSRKTVINILIFYSCPRNRFEREALIKSFIGKVHSSTDKFRCSIKKIFGYLYFIKDQIKSHEVLKMVDYNTAYITKNELHDYIEKNCLTISANQMWKVSAFRQPICNDGTNDSESPQYVMVITVVHCVGDGPAVASVFKKVLEEDLSKSRDLSIRKHIRHSRPSLNLSDAFIYRNPLTSELNTRELKSANNFNWHVVTHIETKRKYISIVREIKRKLGVNFMDVIGAAIYSSINDYIMTRNIKMNTFTACKVVRVNEKEEQEILNKTYNLDLMNTSSLELFDVSYGEIQNIKDRILHIHRISSTMHNSIDYLFFLNLQQIVTYLPLSLLRFICSRFMSSVTIGITNLVGFNKSSYCGCSIDDILFHIPDIFQTGFILSIFSYADRMSVTLVSGKGYVHNREELQTILDGYFKYLDEAEKEVLGYRFEDTN